MQWVATIPPRAASVLSLLVAAIIDDASLSTDVSPPILSMHPAHCSNSHRSCRRRVAMPGGCLAPTALTATAPARCLNMETQLQPPRQTVLSYRRRCHAARHCGPSRAAPPPKAPPVLRSRRRRLRHTDHVVEFSRWVNPAGIREWAPSLLYELF
jgi:hypothetical protein